MHAGLRGEGEEAVVVYYKVRTQICLNGPTKTLRVAGVLTETGSGSSTFKSGTLPPREGARCKSMTTLFITSQLFKYM